MRAGTNVLITGANIGIGRATALELGRRGASLFLAGRSEARTRPVLDKLADLGAKAEFLPLDLSDLASVKTCARELLSRGIPLHVLIDNAGLAGVSRGLTEQGFEMTFGVNHLGHYLLTQLLLPALARGAPSRVVVVSSDAHRSVKPSDIDFTRFRKPTELGWREYKMSKLCNVWFANELAARVDPRVTRVYSLHPGFIASEIWRNLPGWLQPPLKLLMRSPEDGTRAILRCATSDDVAGDCGKYYGSDGKERPPSRLAQDRTLAKELWEKSDAWVRPYLD